MLRLRRFIIIIGVVILQVSLLPTLFGHWPVPNLVFATLLVTLMLVNYGESLWWAGMGGILLDLNLPNRGFYTLVFIFLVVGLSYLLERWNMRRQALTALILVVISVSFLTSLEWLVSGGPWSLAWLTAVASQILGVGGMFFIYRLGNVFSARRSGRILEFGQR